MSCLGVLAVVPCPPPLSGAGWSGPADQAPGVGPASRPVVASCGRRLSAAIRLCWSGARLSTASCMSCAARSRPGVALPSWCRAAQRRPM